MFRQSEGPVLRWGLCAATRHFRYQAFSSHQLPRALERFLLTANLNPPNVEESEFSEVP